MTDSKLSGKQGATAEPAGAVSGDAGLRIAEVREPAGARISRNIFFGLMCLLVGLMLLGPVLLPPKVTNLHYAYLAENLLQGRLSVDDLPSRYPDAVLWNGHKYLPLGPLPALLTIPFLPLLQSGVHLVWVGYLFTLLNIWLLYWVLGLSGVTGDRRRWALLLFFGGTVYYSVAIVGSSYFFAHIVTVTFILLAIGEALGKRRPVLIGLLLGLAGMTRLTSLFCLPFFLWIFWRHIVPEREDSDGHDEQADTGHKVSRFAFSFGGILLGLAGPLLALLAYNYLRFGSPFESGYNIAVLGIDALTNARAYGLFSLVHVPKNLFMMLLQGPLPYPSEDAPVLQFPYFSPSPWGMGLLYTSPALLYAFRARLKQPLVQACWLGILFGMAPIITYYGIGWIQFGYRYALDFLPFVLLLAARGFPDPMTRLAKFLVVASALVCAWGSVFLLEWIHVVG